MDFSKYDNRSRAEAGAALHLVDPDTKEPITHNKKPCRVLVRGVASPTIQKQMRERHRERMQKKGEADPSDEFACMEDLHNSLIETAAPYIAGFENIERDGKALTTSEEDVRWFLDLTFPFMGQKTDANGEPIVEDGTPALELKNLPFARQITDFAGDQSNFLGNGNAG